MKNTSLSPETIRQTLLHTHHLFQPIRERFKGASVIRGGHKRVGVRPMYVRMGHAGRPPTRQTIEGYIVEASFSDEQLRYVHQTLSALKAFMHGQPHSSPLSDRIVRHYINVTAPYFTLALLKSTEDVLREFMSQSPEQAAVLDAIFRVAGGEGFRDLIQIYAPRLLDAVLQQTPVPELNPLAFIDVHEAYRKDKTGEAEYMKYEVWCPGHSLALAYYEHCQTAAELLVRQRALTYAPSRREELAIFPKEISAHLNQFVQTLLPPVYEAFGVS